MSSETITRADLAAILNEVLPPSGVEEWTPSITTTSGKLNTVFGYKYGSVYQLRLNVQNSSATANGSNIYTGTLSNHIPILQMTGVGFYGGIAFSIAISDTGIITVRNIGTASLSANNAVTVCITYIAL